MKTNKLLFILLISSLSFSQTKECDCSGPLSKDLKTYISTKEYNDFKDWLYNYYQKDETTRASLKSTASSSWNGQISAFIKSIPVSASGSYDSKTNKDSQKFNRIEQSFLKNQYITNEELNEVLVNEFSETQLSAYYACLDLCKSTLHGISIFTGNNTSDEFYIQVNFKSTPAGGKITLSGNAQTSNIEPIGGLIFKDGLVITDGQSKTQYFKRLDPTKPASFTFNTMEGIIVPQINLSPKPTINQQAIPIGTIVASVLDYSTFLKANKLDEMDNTNMKTALWVPCDGRTLTIGKYAEYSGGTIPDLRGVFLRGINDYGVSFPSVVPVSNEQKNPENKTAGQFQDDQFKSHDHGTKIYDDFYPRTGGSTYNMWRNAKDTRTSKEGGDETRPKNRTVYYYIKIN